MLAVAKTEKGKQRKQNLTEMLYYFLERLKWSKLSNQRRN